MSIKESLKKTAVSAYQMNAETVCKGIARAGRSTANVIGTDAVLDGIIRTCEKLKSQQKPAAPKVSFRERLIKMLEKKQGEAV